MGKSNAQKQADYRARMMATHARVIVYLPRDIAALAAANCLQTGQTMSELITSALIAFNTKSKK